MVEASPLSTELGLLCHCDLASDERLAEFVASASALDWERFRKLVSFNAMGGMVHARLSLVAPDLLPPSIADYLAELGPFRIDSAKA